MWWHEKIDPNIPARLRGRLLGLAWAIDRWGFRTVKKKDWPKLLEPRLVDWGAHGQLERADFECNGVQFSVVWNGSSHFFHLHLYLGTGKPVVTKELELVAVAWSELAYETFTARDE